MVLDATVGGPSANSYITLATANTYLAARLGTKLWFTNLPTMDDRPAALMWATALLETLVQWHGRPATTTQALAWPQIGQVDAWGHQVLSTVIPESIQRATAIYALALLQEQQDLATGTGTALVKSRKIGDMTITYQDVSSATPQGSQRSPQVALPAEVRALLRPYATMAGSLMVPLVRT
jgi:hypothetical protein